MAKKQDVGSSRESSWPLSTSWRFLVSTSRRGISWPSIGWHRQVRIDAYGVASSHPPMEMSDVGQCRECPALAGPRPNANAMASWHEHAVLERVMGDDIARLKRLGDVAREVSKGFEADLQHSTTHWIPAMGIHARKPRGFSYEVFEMDGNMSALRGRISAARGKGTIPLGEGPSPSLQLGAANAALRHDDLSQGSDRFGQPGLDAAYLCPSCQMSGITLSVSGSIQSEPLVHLCPSQTAR